MTSGWAEAGLPKETPQKEQIKVTDKRIFTPDGEIREEFRDQIRPSDPARAAAAPPAPPEQEARADHDAGADPSARRRSVAEKAASPGTPFANFIEPLIAQAYMNLGMLPNPYAPQAKPDVAAARQMIDILTLLQEKTAGNLTPDEDDFLSTHIGELKLAFVKRTKSL
ncbi:MAG TPA: DUF1844 domain-containing protein [Thermoanaerobaculia bacterium]|nr:DUF1844 domain-containing protein [Thermoanaerobaculia bacterium]